MWETNVIIYAFCDLKTIFHQFQLNKTMVKSLHGL